MSDKEIIKLVKLVEETVVAALVIKGYVTIKEGDEFLFKNIDIPLETMDKLGIVGNDLLNDEFLDTLLDMFPKYYVISKKEFRTRVHEFLKRTNVENITQQEVIDAVREHCAAYSSPKYAGKITNFFYLYENKTYTSKLENIIIKNREIVEDLEYSEVYLGSK